MPQKVQALWEQPMVTRRMKLLASLGGRNTMPSALSRYIYDASCCEGRPESRFLDGLKGSVLFIA
jgi:hypothetical protein